MECKYLDEISEEWILQHCGIDQSQICVVEKLDLTGSIRQKLTSLSNALVSFISLTSLDLSRNHISSLEGLQFCQELESINIYYNNISAMSELTKLAKNSKLKEIDVRLNPVSVMSTEYRLLLVHALPTLTKLDNVAVTEKDRMLSLTYHSTDQASQLTGYHGDGVAAGDCRLASGTLEDGENSVKSSATSGKSGPSSCEGFIKDLRPPLSVLQAPRTAYDAYATHAAFTPNPKRHISREPTPSAPSPLKDKYVSENKITEENKRLREKYREYKNKYNEVLSQRISKESYVKLQEDYYKSLKKNEELEEVYKTSSEEVMALKQHVNNLTQENTTLKKELSIKEQVSEVDKQIKEVCRELQETMERDRERYLEQVEQFSDKYEDLAKTFSGTLANMEKKYKEEALIRSQHHKAQVEKFHENFVNLKNVVDVAKIFDLSDRTV